MVGRPRFGVARIANKKVGQGMAEPRNDAPPWDLDDDDDSFSFSIADEALDVFGVDDDLLVEPAEDDFYREPDDVP